MRKQIELIYTGGGSLPGIPARDLTREEVAQFGRERLLATGLYTEAVSNKKLSGGKENKLMTREGEDKDGRD